MNNDDDCDIAVKGIETLQKRCSYIGTRVEHEKVDSRANTSMRMNMSMTQSEPNISMTDTWDLTLLYIHYHLHRFHTLIVCLPKEQPT